VTHPLVDPILSLHRRIRADVVAACEQAALESLSHVASDDEGDTIYAIDRVAEHVLIEEIGRTIATDLAPVVLVAEGLPGGRAIVPEGADASRAAWTIIVDPIDGTRGLMYQKRPGWILTGVARHRPEPSIGGANAPPPQRPERPALSDIELAVQTEIPLVKQHLCDEVWAVRGHGATATRVNRLSGASVPLTLRPSASATIAHGFATISRFFPGIRAELAAIDDELVGAILGPPQPGKAQLFEDQYISSGGQLYELMAGHDRFVADLRPLFERRKGAAGPALCCHPYDLCTELIARELGIVVTDERGGALDAPLDVTSDVTWVGYANMHLRQLIEPLLQQALSRRGLLA
jgi:fructose-1,6-bisphosphatase/inositol monophosphatase family enzyme